jgi:hypothetical protein
MALASVSSTVAGSKPKKNPRSDARCLAVEALKSANGTRTRADVGRLAEEENSPQRPESALSDDRVTGAFGLTNRSSQPLAAVKSTFDLMRQFSMSVALALASGGSARSR